MKEKMQWLDNSAWPEFAPPTLVPALLHGLHCRCVGDAYISHLPNPVIHHWSATSRRAGNRLRKATYLDFLSTQLAPAGHQPRPASSLLPLLVHELLSRQPADLAAAHDARHAEWDLRFVFLTHCTV